MASGDRPGLIGAAGTLELLLQVLQGEVAAIDYVDPYLQERAEAFERHHVQGGIFEVQKPNQFSSHGSGRRAAPVFRGPELFPGAREAAGLVAPGQTQSQGYAPAGASNVLRGAGYSVGGQPADARRDLRTAPPDSRRDLNRGAPTDARRDLRSAPPPAVTGTFAQTRSTGSLQQSGSSIVATRGQSASSGMGSGRRPSGPTVYQDLDRAYMKDSSARPASTDMDALRARLSAVIEGKGSATGGKHPSLERASASKPGTANLGTTASTTLPSEPRRSSLTIPNKEMLLAGNDTPLTARSDNSELAGDGAFDIVNDIVDTCVELEHTQASMSRSDPRLARSGALALSQSASQLFTARAALAAAASAEACSAAAEVAAAASAEAAREAAKCVAAAKAATGRYNHLVDYVMTNRGTSAEITMSPSQRLPELKGPSADSDSGSEASPVTQDGGRKGEEEDDIAQDKLEHTIAGKVKEHALPLDNPVNLQEFKLVVSILELDANEAGNIFKDMCEEDDVEFDPLHTFPMEDFLETLQIDPEDHEGVANFAEALQKAREEIDKNPDVEIVEKSGGCALRGEARVRQLFDKLLRHMAYHEVTKKDAWKFVTETIQNDDSDHKKQIVSRAEIEVLKGYTRNSFEKVFEGFWETPPVICASGGQVGNKEKCTRLVNDIIKECKANGTQYTDPDWDMKSFPNKVLYVDEQEPGYDCTVAPPANFKRMTVIVKKAVSNKPKSAMGAMGSMFGGAAKKPAAGAAKDTKPIVFKGEVCAGDIVQGQIGTCFLLGAIGSMASHKGKALTKIFIKYDVDVGVYGIRFCVDGEWSYVIVDDWMPVDSNGELMYARCKDPQEIWVPILEKAFCKLHTCYEMCDGGQASEALNCFFGGVTGKINIKKHHRDKPSSLFNILKNARDKGWMCATSFVAQPGARSQGNGKCGEDMLPSGLVGGHAYSVLKIVEACGNQLVQCRNPWGSGEWTGKWSDQNEYGEWTDEIKKETGAEFKDDGKFWMSIEDFANNCGGVEYARTFGPNWKKVTRYSRFGNQVLMATAKRNYKGKGASNLSFNKGDQIRIKEISGDIFYGHHKGQEKNLGTFMGRMVHIDERPVLRFDLIATRDEGSKDPVTAVIMLMQRNVIMQRKWSKKPEYDNMNYKETNYATIQIIVINPKGEVAFKKVSRERCVWGEVEMPGGGLWKVYALCNDGKGSPAIVRSYLKGGILSFKEVKGTKYSEVAPFMFDDD